SEKKQLHTGIYETELKIEDFEDHLVRTILSNKGDGLDLNIYSTKNCTYIDIDLIIHDDETEPNIDYIINFLESFHSEKGHNKINDLKKFDTYIYVESTSTLEMKSLIDALTEESTNIEAVSEVRTTFEHGAGSFICGFLIGIISNAAWYAI